MCIQLLNDNMKSRSPTFSVFIGLSWTVLLFLLFSDRTASAQSGGQFNCAQHACNGHMDRACLRVRTAFAGLVRSEFVGNNCACCVHTRAGRVAEAGISLQKNIVADVKQREFRYSANAYCTAYACGGVYDTVCSKLVAEQRYPDFISRNILCQCCVKPGPSAAEIESLFNRNVVEMVWKKESIPS